jgi:hypothetical protein
MSLKWPFKDPDEILDYTIDWGGSAELPGRTFGDTILTATFTVPVGLVKNSESHTISTATVWLSGGTVGATYEILCRITTAGGRTMDQTSKLSIKAK